MSFLALFDIPRPVLPRIAPSSSASAFGTTRANGPVGAKVPIAGCLGDQHAALVGQACFAPGEAKNTYGTGRRSSAASGGSTSANARSWRVRAPKL